MADLLAEEMVHVSNGACVDDVTPPTFAGIASLSANANGSLSASWAAATDTATPIRYEIYVQASTAIGLFSTSNIAMITNQLSAGIYSLSDASLLLSGVVYFVGVRSVDSVGNRDSNTASLSEISNGVPDDSVASIINALNQIAGFATQDVVGIVDDDSDLLGSIEDDTDLIGTVEDC